MESWHKYLLKVTLSMLINLSELQFLDQKKKISNPI